MEKYLELLKKTVDLKMSITDYLLMKLYEDDKKITLNSLSREDRGTLIQACIDELKSNGWVQIDDIKY